MAQAVAIAKRRALLRPRTLTPRQITGLAAYFDPSTLALADAAAVTAYPESWGGNSCDQGTAANRPTYRTGGINGFPSVRFDGSNDVLVDTTPSGMALGATFSILAVVQRSSTAIGGICTIGNSTGGREFRIAAAAGNQLQLVKPGSSSFTGTAALTSTTTPYVVGVTYDGATCNFYLAGALDRSVGGSITFVDGDLVIGARNSSATEPFPGELGILLVYNRALRAVTMRELSRYLARRYGLALG